MLDGTSVCFPRCIFYKSRFSKKDFHSIVLQPRPQFQPSFKGGENTSGSAASSAKAASEPVERPFSYADYIVQSKRTVAAPAQTERCSKLLQKSLCESDPVSSASGRCEGEGGSEGDKKSEDPQVTGTHQKEGNGHPRSDPSPSLGPKPVGSGSSIIVSPRQVRMYVPPHLGSNSLHLFIHPSSAYSYSHS